jgi:hypothetical protein
MSPTNKKKFWCFAINQLISFMTTGHMPQCSVTLYMPVASLDPKLCFTYKGNIPNLCMEEEAFHIYLPVKTTFMSESIKMVV